MTDQPFTDEQLDASRLLSKDLLLAADQMSLDTARFMIATYYLHQKERIAKSAQIRECKTRGEPTAILEHFMAGEALLESQAGKALLRFARKSSAGRWALEQKGVGGVITAGLISMIDMDIAVSPSHMISHAGLNPQQKWEKGQKRPFNADLKTLAVYKLGECLVKVQNREGAFYGKLFKEFKAQELQRNDAGDHITTARKDANLEKKDKKGKSQIGLYGRSTDAWPWVNGCYQAGASTELANISKLPLPEEIMDLEGKEFTTEKRRWQEAQRVEALNRLKGEPGSGQPMLPPSQVHGRARRRAVKIFLQHFWEELYVEKYAKQPPEPYVFAHLGHVHKIERPNPTLS